MRLHNVVLENAVVKMLILLHVQDAVHHVTLHLQRRASIIGLVCCLFRVPLHLRVIPRCRLLTPNFSKHRCLRIIVGLFAADLTAVRLRVAIESAGRDFIEVGRVLVLNARVTLELQLMLGFRLLRKFGEIFVELSLRVHGEDGRYHLLLWRLEGVNRARSCHVQ